MKRPVKKPRRFLQPLLLIPGLKLFVQLLAVPGYGVFRDELYYVACSERLAAGYVDHPPLSIFVLRLVRELFGDGLWPMRGTVALVSAAAVLVVGLVARRMGGGAVAQSLAMIAFTASPIQWFLGHFYSMNAFDTLFWALAAWLIVILVQEGSEKAPERRTWAALGVVLGLGLLNKISVLWLGFGLGAGLLLTAERRHLRTVGPWLAAGLAGLVFAPYLLWQVQHGWPTLEFIANATGNKMVSVSPAAFVAGQVEVIGGWISAGFALFGLGVLFFDREGRRYAVLGWIYVAVFLLLVTSGSSRAGYLAPAYTWLTAAAGWGFERLVAGRRQWVRVAAVGVLGVLIAARGALALPMVLPILPPADFVAYARALGVEPSTEERKELGALPQHYADMFGWPEKVRAARGAYEGLTPAERRVACLFAWNYGVAGALENEALALSGDPTPGVRADADPLPPTLSGHNNYWLWGPGVCTGEVLIVLGGNAEDLAESFESVERVGTVDCEYCMPYEDEQPVFVGRGPSVSLEEIWPRLKHYD